MRFPKTMLKDILREIWKTKGRFLAILVIVALGTGFFAGLKVTCADIKQTASEYFQETNLTDFRLTSTYGVMKDDIAALQARGDVAAAMGGYSADMFGNMDGSKFVVKLLAFEGDLNRLTVKEGRLPAASGECVIERILPTTEKVKIGDRITFAAGGEEKTEDILKKEAYTVVGIAESSLFVSDERGMSAIGDGNADCFAVIRPEDFAYDAYTDVYVTLKAAAGLGAYSPDYDNLIGQETDELETFAKQRGILRYQEIADDANSEIADAQAELVDGENELAQESADAEEQLADAKKKLDAAEKKLKNGKAELKANRQKAEAGFAAAQKKLDEGEQQYAATLALYQKSKIDADANLPAVKAGLTQLETSIDELQASIALLEQTDPASPLLEGMKTQLAGMQQQYGEGMAQVEQTESGLTAMQTGLAEARAQLDQGKQELAGNKAVFAKEMQKAQAELDSGEKQLNDGKKEYQEGLAELAAEKKKGEDKLADAREEIQKAQADVAAIEWPKWYVFDRTDNPGYTDFGQNADSVDKISLVFPVFFILTAILVSLTTMTRMVEERRVQIGTMKALGYSRSVIMVKYMLYAFMASFFGSAAGVFIGFKIFPWAAFTAFKISYIMPPLQMPFHWDYAVLCTLAAVFVTLGATYLSCYRELAECPAELMRPRAPKAGRRLLIERIGALWKWLSFAYKVTLRNIFRYKKRALMTIVGIAGCTALMLAGFGLRHSILSVAPVQFGELFVYDGVVAEKADLTAAGKVSLYQQIRSNAEISDQMPVLQDSAKAAGEKKKQDVNLIVPEDAAGFSAYVTLRERETGKAVSLEESGTVVSEKLASDLGLKAGSDFSLQTDSGAVTLRVGGITENYTDNFVYVSPAVYREKMGADAGYNCIFFHLKAGAEQGEVSSRLMENENVQGISFMADSRENMESSMSNLSYVVIVIILSAGALGIVVLYNLMNINIAERTREIATIKVLGFHLSETAAYVYRENFICTGIGIALGLGLGTLLEGFVLTTVQLEKMMFLQGIDLLSYVFSAVLTVAFTLLVDVFFYFKLKKLSMVESMKSVE